MNLNFSQPSSGSAVVGGSGIGVVSAAVVASAVVASAVVASAVVASAVVASGVVSGGVVSGSGGSTHIAGDIGNGASSWLMAKSAVKRINDYISNILDGAKYISTYNNGQNANGNRCDVKFHF